MCSFRIEILPVYGIQPAGKARNTGALKAKGSIICFFDSDLVLADEQCLENLVHTLMSDERIGIVCAAIRLSPNATRFEKRYAGEVPHSESPIVECLTDVFIATAACCAIYRDFFWDFALY